MLPGAGTNQQIPVFRGDFGMGTVVATSGVGDAAKADVDFGSVGLKRLSLKHAPMEKL